MTIIEFCVSFIIIFSVLIGSLEYSRNKQLKKWYKLVYDAKEQLENAGLKFNHSYQLIHKNDGNIRFLRIFELKYNHPTEKVYAHVYMTTKDGEIGTWYDDYTYVLDIPNKWELKDNGEWNPE